MMTESSASSIRTDGMHQGEAKVSTTMTAIILVLTVLGILGLSGCDSQVEEDKASDWTTKVAATIDGHDITEADVNDFIEKYRKAYGHTTDASWATFLDSQGRTASDYRYLAIEQLEERYLVQRLAGSSGIAVSDSDVNDAVTEARQSAGYDGDDDGWEMFLESLGYTKDEYAETLRTTMLVDAYAEANKIAKTPTDAQMRAYASKDTGRYTGKKVCSATFETRTSALDAKRAIDGQGDITPDAFANAMANDGGSVATIGWSGMSTLTSGATTAISTLDVGQSSDIVHEDDGYVIYYVAQRFLLASDGTVSVNDMPSDLYETLKSETSASINASTKQECLSNLVESYSPTKNDMPGGLPYDIDIEANSTCHAEDANVNQEGSHG